MSSKSKLTVVGIYLTALLLTGAAALLGWRSGAGEWEKRFAAQEQVVAQAEEGWKAGEIYTAERDAEAQAWFKDAWAFQAELVNELRTLNLKTLILDGSAALLTLLALWLVMRGRPKARRFGILAGHSFTFLLLSPFAGVAAFGLSKIQVPVTPPNVTRFLTNAHNHVGTPMTEKHHEVLLQLLHADHEISEGEMEAFRSMVGLAEGSVGALAFLTLINGLVVLLPVKKGADIQTGSRAV